MRRNANGRARIRDLGIEVGVFPVGPNNAITDVDGVMVGHATVHEPPKDENTLPVRTGVTAVWPNRDNIFEKSLVGGAFILNGAGEMSGLIQVLEWGMIETPILLTNTLSVGSVSRATVKYMLQKYPEIGKSQDVLIPLVGECDDSFLNDIRGIHIGTRHVASALSSAKSGPVQEGCVGGGTGMVSFDLKSGIGTSSRIVSDIGEPITVGVLVMNNMGRMPDLLVAGRPVGVALNKHFASIERRRTLYGSIIAVLATNAPLLPLQMSRLCKRVALGIGRVGSYAAHGSGEIVVGFSTANTIPRGSDRVSFQMTVLNDRMIDPLYRATIECTEEAILNSLTAAESVEGGPGPSVPALPLDWLRDWWNANA